MTDPAEAADVRWRRFAADDPRLSDLVRFHAATKFALLAHSEGHLRRLGRLVAGAKGRPRADVLHEYGRLHAEAFACAATPGSHRNALEHLAGFLSDALTGAERVELQRAIADFAEGAAPLAVPIGLLRRLAHRQAATYVLAQFYLAYDSREPPLRRRQ